MRFDVPTGYCDFTSDVKAGILKSAERAIRENETVYFEGKHFTNFDELTRYLADHCEKLQSDPDWPGERLDN